LSTSKSPLAKPLATAVALAQYFGMFIAETFLRHQMPPTVQVPTVNATKKQIGPSCGSPLPHFGLSSNSSGGKRTKNLPKTALFPLDEQNRRGSAICQAIIPGMDIVLIGIQLEYKQTII
jgi:hypothetical protein